MEYFQLVLDNISNNLSCDSWLSGDEVTVDGIFGKTERTEDKTECWAEGRFLQGRYDARELPGKS